MTSTFTHTLDTPLLTAQVVHTVTMADADLQTLMNYLVVKFTGRGQVAPTPDQAIELWLQEAFNRTLAEEVNFRQLQQAPPTVAPLPITMT